MANSKPWRSLLKTIAKLAISGFFLYMVFRKIDYRDLLFQMGHTALWWILPALLLFVLSKWISSIRLNLFFKSIGLHLSEKENLRLYWLGMFYNMFLPGGIGGDGYKIYLLNRKFQSPAKKLFWAVFLDRVSGLGALLFLCALLVMFIFPTTRIILGMMGLMVLACLAYYFVYQKYFPSFMDCFWRTNFQGLLVQITQVICACCIMKALHIESHYPEYILLFLISSVVAIFPFTMGGLGARELSFVYGSEYLMLDQQSSVVISFWFYLITLVVSLVGIIYVFRSPFENEMATAK
jgi:uncharacterized membrane protein YbhN (UPF0104 family)